MKLFDPLKNTNFLLKIKKENLIFFKKKKCHKKQKNYHSPIK